MTKNELIALFKEYLNLEVRKIIREELGIEFRRIMREELSLINLNGNLLEVSHNKDEAKKIPIKKQEKTILSSELRNLPSFRNMFSEYETPETPKNIIQSEITENITETEIKAAAKATAMCRGGEDVPEDDLPAEAINFLFKMKK
jgi:hypothetical protein